MTRQTTSIGVKIEYQEAMKKRITAAGLGVEYKEAQKKRLTVAGLEVEYQGIQQQRRITDLGILLEYQPRYPWFIVEIG